MRNITFLINNANTFPVKKMFRLTTAQVWRRGGLMAAALDSGSSGLGSSPDRGHCFVFLARHFTLTVAFMLRKPGKAPI